MGTYAFVGEVIKYNCIARVYDVKLDFRRE